jgi:hypothetical protein
LRVLVLRVKFAFLVEMAEVLVVESHIKAKEWLRAVIAEPGAAVEMEAVVVVAGAVAAVACKIRLCLEAVRHSKCLHALAEALPPLPCSHDCCHADSVGC